MGDIDILETAGLGEITDTQTRRLFSILFNWQTCGSCVNLTECTTTGCSTRRADRLGPFKTFYQKTTSRYLPEFSSSSETALRSHDDMIDIVQCIKGGLNTRRDELMRKYFTDRANREGHGETPELEDQERAFNMGVRILTMVNCSAENQVAVALEEGCKPITWANSDSAIQFINKSFPTTDHPTLNDPAQSTKAASLKTKIQAQRLKKMAGLTFKGTDNLANHLQMDLKRGYVEIFHHTRFLKEYLLSTQKPDGALPDQAPLPRQLALEVLDTIQKVLFPLESPSESILQALVVKQGFDPDCLRLVEPAATTTATATYRRQTENEDTMTYRYFGGRLMDLAHEVEHPTPRGLLDKWLERRSGARYVMLATLVGVAVAVFLGFLSLGVSVFQAWVGWQAWKNPVTSN